MARGWLGVEIQPVTPGSRRQPRRQGRLRRAGRRGAEEFAGRRGGVKSGDVITSVNGEAVADPRELARRIAALGPKKTAELAIVRNGAQMTIEVTLGAMPTDKTASADSADRRQRRAASMLAKLGLTLDAAQARTASSSPRSIPTAPPRTRA